MQNRARFSYRMASNPKGVGDILDKLDELAGKSDNVLIGDTVEAFGTRSYGPFLLVPALIEISPIGGVPVVPTLLAGIIILFAGQILIGRKKLWLPAFLRERSIRSARLKKASFKLRGIARLLDRWFHGRLPALTGGPGSRVAAVAVILLALTVPPLELLPFASTAPMAAIAAFGLALLVHDGLLMIVAFVFAGGAIAAGAGLVSGQL